MCLILAQTNAGPVSVDAFVSGGSDISVMLAQPDTGPVPGDVFTFESSCRTL